VAWRCLRGEAACVVSEPKNRHLDPETDLSRSANRRRSASAVCLSVSGEEKEAHKQEERAERSIILGVGASYVMVNSELPSFPLCHGLDRPSLSHREEKIATVTVRDRDNYRPTIY
jgi:hypothetical protein